MCPSWGHSGGFDENALFFKQGLDFDIIFAKPVLVVSGGRAEHLEACRVNRRLQRFPVVASSLRQLAFEGVSQFLLNSWKFDLVDVEPFHNRYCYISQLHVGR